MSHIETLPFYSREAKRHLSSQLKKKKSPNIFQNKTVSLKGKWIFGLSFHLHFHFE